MARLEFDWDNHGEIDVPAGWRLFQVLEMQDDYVFCILKDANFD